MTAAEKTRRIPVAGPWITEKEIEYVTDAVSSAWYTDANIYHSRFERAFAEHTGRRFAMALPSCTSAIHLALAASGIGPGDEVIVPEITWIATAAPISYVGARPVFADIDEKTWCLSPESFRQRITSKTRAVIPVDLYGNMADLPAIIDIARQRGIAVIEDAAQAVGGRIGSRPAGAFGNAGVFSFHGTKTLTTGEGGMLVTDDEQLFRKAGILRDHGRLPGDSNFYNSIVAFKYKMSAMQAALGLAQLERLEALIARKREAFEWYREELADVAGLTLNHEAPGTRSTFWMITAIVNPSFGVTKDVLRERLSERGIDTRPFFHPLSSLPAYEHLRPVPDNPVAYRISPYGINLSSSLRLTREDVQYVAHELRAILGLDD
jgi:perosamine synthetase